VEIAIDLSLYFKLPVLRVHRLPIILPLNNLMVNRIYQFSFRVRTAIGRVS